MDFSGAASKRALQLLQQNPTVFPFQVVVMLLLISLPVFTGQVSLMGFAWNATAIPAPRNSATATLTSFILAPFDSGFYYLKIHLLLRPDRHLR